MTRGRRRAAAVGGVLAAVAAAVVYLLAADLWWLRGPLSRAASRALGRELRIDGPFGLRLGSVIRISAEDLVLAGAPGGRVSAPVRVDRLVVELEARSLIRGPLRVISLRAAGVRLHLETPSGSRRSRIAGRGPGEPRPGGSRPLPRFDSVEIADLSVTLLREPPGGPVEFVLRRTRGREDGAGILHLALEGSAAGRPLEVSGRAGPLDSLAGGGGVEVDLRLGLGTLAGRIRGRTASLASLAGARLHLELAGPDGKVLAELLGVRPPGSGPFEARVDIGPGEEPGSLGVDARIRSALLEAGARGSVGPGRPPAVDLAVEAVTGDAGRLGALLRIRGIPRERAVLSGRVRGRGFPLELEDLDLRVGNARLEARGVLGRPGKPVGTALTFALEAPDGSLLARIASVEPPPGAVRARGSVEVGEAGLTLEGLRGRVGAIWLEADGVLASGRGLAGSRLGFSIRGPDLSRLGPLAGVSLPEVPFEARGRLTMDGTGLLVESLEGRLGGDRVRVHGRVGTGREPSGTELEIRAEGDTPALLGSLVGVRGLPPEPYRGRARLVLRGDEVLVEGIDATLGGHLFRGAVRMARPPGSGAIRLDLDASGPVASALETLTGLHPLPEEPFSARGVLLVGPETIGFEGFSARVGTTELALGGELHEGGGLVGTVLEFAASGEDLSEMGRVLGLGGLPAVAFDLAGVVEVEEDGYHLGGLRGTVADNRLLLDGLVRPAGAATAVALDLDLQGEDLTSLGRILEGLGVGAAPRWLRRRPYTFAGHVDHGSDGFSFGNVVFSTGNLSGRLEGRVGPAPRFEGTDLAVAARSTGGLRAGRFGIEGFRLDAHVGFLPHQPGTPGSSLALSGNLVLDSLRLEPAGGTGKHGLGEGARETRGEEPGLFFSDEPFDLAILDTFEGRVRCEVAELDLPLGRLQGLDVDFRLEDGGLHVDSLTVAHAGGGFLEGSLALAPLAGGYGVELAARLHETHLELSAEGIPREAWPPLDARIEFRGAGRSLHEVMASSRGRFGLVVGEGTVASGVLDFLGDSFLLQVVDALNPFGRAGGTTALECMVAAGRIEDGAVTLDPLGVRTSAVTTLGRGTIDLETERQDIVFQSKPRRGVGLSASLVTNSLFKVGGTLKRPALEFKPLSAAAVTGAAVVTAGLSVLAQGLWNRLTSNTETCPALLEEVRRLWEDEPRSAGETGKGR